MDYKILIPVTNAPQLVAETLRNIPDKSKLILVNNLDYPEVMEECRRAQLEGAEVYGIPENFGIGPSWNIGMRRMEEDDCQFVIFLSVSARFDKSINYFIDAIIDVEAKTANCRYICSPTASLHCFAHTRKGLQMGGYFDENFWPAYYEDTDYCQRSKFNGVQDYVVMFGLEDVVHSRAFGIAMQDCRLMNLFQCNAHRIMDYYIRKWGGVPLQETFSTPFNNPDVEVNTWTIEGGFTNTLIGACNWVLPSLPDRRL